MSAPRVLAFPTSGTSASRAGARGCPRRPGGRAAGSRSVSEPPVLRRRRRLEEGEVDGRGRRERSPHGGAVGREQQQHARHHREHQPEQRAALAGPQRQRRHDGADGDGRERLRGDDAPDGEPREREEAPVLRTPAAQRRGQRHRHRHGRGAVGKRIGREEAHGHGHERQARRCASDRLRSLHALARCLRHLARQRPRRHQQRRAEQRPDEHGRADEEARGQQQRVAGREDPGDALRQHAQQVARAEARAGLRRRPRELAVRQRAPLQPVHGRERIARTAAQVERDVPERQERDDEAGDPEEAAATCQVRHAGEVDEGREPGAACGDEGGHQQHHREAQRELRRAVRRAPPASKRAGRGGGGRRDRQGAGRGDGGRSGGRRGGEHGAGERVYHCATAGVLEPGGDG